MNTTNRIDTFISTLRIAHKTGVLSTYNDSTPIDKLSTLTGNVSDLCWEIAAHAKHSASSNKIITADGIKHNATNIVNICITELKNLGHTTESAIELIATDGALWFWSLPLRPLSATGRTAGNHHHLHHLREDLPRRKHRLRNQTHIKDHQ